jgi:hypothetical protein
MREAGMTMSEDKPEGPIEKSATRRDQQDEEARRYRPGTGLSVADLRARSYWIGFAVGAVAVALVFLVAWPLVDKYVWVHDDRGLGEDFRTVVHPRDGECELIAKALYGHGILVLANNTYDDEGWASKAEKAFWEGCTDSDHFLND